MSHKQGIYITNCFCEGNGSVAKMVTLSQNDNKKVCFTSLKNMVLLLVYIVFI